MNGTSAKRKEIEKKKQNKTKNENNKEMLCNRKQKTS